MKKIILSLAAAGAVTLLTGCVVLPVSEVGTPMIGSSTMNGAHLEKTPRDRDGDGVPNRQDIRPNNPNR